MRPHELGLVEAAEAIAMRTLSAVELATDCLAVIAAREPQVGAWVHIDPEQVLREARRLDNQRERGPLHGVPVAIKDIIDTGDMPTCSGSPIYTGRRPGMDAAAVALLRRSGALVMGKTVTTEFAYFQAGKTRNPHNLEHTPGGSSSGSAAAVASHMVPAALGSQTAGSLIRPASYCGVVGYKPTYGDFPTTGVKGLAHSLDTLGTLSRCVADARLLRSVLTADTVFPFSSSERWIPSIGLCRTPDWLQASPETRHGLEQLLLSLGACGARVGDAQLPPGFSDFADLQRKVMAYETARSLAPEHDGYREQLSEPLRALIDHGQSLSTEEYSEARCCAEQGMLATTPLFEEWDVLLAPSAPGTAPLASDGTGDPLFSRMWMLLGVPTLSLPALTGQNGLPIGIQLVGSRYGDDRLLRAAQWVERVLSDRPRFSLL
ncbi:amidase [Pseudomonas sp. ATCC 13867]|uniref:amidase n=1 Tax=Pseudomonas sp. ATCC 13867 TaxID=1294143 RepID=UPI0002C4EE04|nr:amidase [Pseudomonas sp. ATCC 13867]AGI24763.1 amidase [Pseudomonas sp. ATCC 13867]RFQ27520.1 amidase [Pseudomonas sp. ATCC 13867]